MLESSLQRINDWRKKLKAGTIDRHHFLSESTAKGLRVTILWTIQLSMYLFKNDGFKYVLTVKLNQDILGTFSPKQSRRPNEHTCLPTFLRIYNMLSICSLVKPLKTGNCRVQANEETRLRSPSCLARLGRGVAGTVMHRYVNHLWSP